MLQNPSLFSPWLFARVILGCARARPFRTLLVTMTSVVGRLCGLAFTALSLGAAVIRAIGQHPLLVKLIFIAALTVAADRLIGGIPALLGSLWMASLLLQAGPLYSKSPAAALDETAEAEFIASLKSIPDAELRRRAKAIDAAKADPAERRQRQLLYQTLDERREQRRNRQ